METVDLYNILHVPKDVSPDDLKRAYKKLCIQHHPDKGGDENEFKKISEAYNILKDPEKRQIYDRYGMEGLRQGVGGMDENMQSMMENLFGFKFPFGGGKRPSQKQRVHHVLEVSLEDIVNGNSSLPFRFSRKVLNRTKPKVMCNLCKGQGFRVMMQNVGFMQMQQQVRCPQCQGTRYERADELFDTTQEEVHLMIPKNCAENHAFILKNRMDEDVNGESTGDVVIVVKYATHPRFRREDANLVVTITLTFIESLCGFERTLSLLNGQTMDVVYPSMVRWKERLCIPGKGLFLENRYGDLFIEFDIAYPDEMTTSILQEIHTHLQHQSSSLTWKPDTMKLVSMQESKDKEPSPSSSATASNASQQHARPPIPPFQGPPGMPQGMECHQQ